MCWCLSSHFFSLSNLWVFSSPIGVLRKFKGCLKFQGCFKKVSSIFQWSFKDVYRKFQGCLKEVSRVFQGSFWEISRMFQERFKISVGIWKKFKGISRMFQETFNGVPRKLLGCLKEDWRVFQVVLTWFQGCFTSFVHNFFYNIWQTFSHRNINMWRLNWTFIWTFLYIHMQKYCNIYMNI